MSRGGGLLLLKYLESEHDARSSNLYQGSSHVFTDLDGNGLTAILISSENYLF